MPITDHRTQIYLPQTLYALVKQQADHQGVSMAQVIRNALKESVVAKVEKKKSSKKKNNSYDQIMKLSGSLKGGPTDFSENCSQYIAQMYKEKKI